MIVDVERVRKVFWVVVGKELEGVESVMSRRSIVGVMFITG